MNQTYTYSSAGELLTSTVSGGNLSQAYKYTYDDNNEHRLKTARSNNDIGFAFGYNDNGTLKSTRMGTIKDTGVTDLTKDYLESNQTYTSNGNYVSTITDNTGEITTYNIDEYTGKTNGIKDPNEGYTAYTYNTKEQLTGVSGKTSSTGTELASVSYTYEDLTERLKKINHNGTEYTFVYDSFGNMTSVKAGNHQLVTENEFYDNNGSLRSSTYGNGYTVSYTYDKLGRVLTETQGNKVISYVYDARGNIAKIKENGTVTATYTYDLADRLIKVEMGDVAVSYVYDDIDRNPKTVYTVGGTSYSVENSYENAEKDMRLSQTIVDDYTITYSGYDALNRLTYSAIFGAGSIIKQQRITYEGFAGEANRTTSRVSRFIESVHGGNGTSYDYTYDANGNIRTVKDNLTSVTTTYTYDALNRLIGSSSTSGRSATYTYDEGSNIVSKTTTVNGTTSTQNYTYGDATWKDLLTNYDGQAIYYDAIGNPTTYRGKSLTWNGRQLMTYGTNASYTYDAAGIRKSKTVGGATTTYNVVGSTILSQTKGSQTLVFLYDGTGSLIGFKDLSSGEDYFYVKNLQGDIIRIVDSLTNLVATYEYDDWGKLLIAEDNLTAVGKLNPFRYRGYYYDTESSLYYLNSRYYDPETGRFINADALIYSDTKISGYNLFSYCENDPVNLIDPDGNIPIVIPVGIKMVVAGIGAVGALLALYSQKDNIAEGLGHISNAVEDVFGKDKKKEKEYTVYALSDENGVQYVGRTSDYEKRIATHRRSDARGHLVPTVLADGLSYEAARGLEQHYMILYHTYNNAVKMNNQINGISYKNVNKIEYIKAAAETLVDYTENMLINEFYNFWEGF